MGEPTVSLNKRYLEGFLSHLAHERRLSSNTVESYARDVRKLLQLVDEAVIAEVQAHQARRMVAQLHARGLDGRSLARMLSAWRAFFRYLARDHAFTRNPFQGLKAPKSAKTLPNALSPDEASKLMTIRSDEPMDVRDHAMFELFYSSGLRLAELTGLKLEDLSEGDETVRLTGKGSKTRIVPVGRFAR